MPRTSDETRSNLIDAAKSLYHQQGFHRTTLAHVATAAEIPLGSLYYYFRSKDALAHAVIDAHAAEIQAWFQELDLLPTPLQRLAQMLAATANHAEVFVRYGCPYGTLAVELDKGDNNLVAPVGNLLALYVTWIARQIEQMGTDEQQAHTKAIALVGSLQGAYLLSSAFRDPKLLEQEMARLIVDIEQWSPASMVSH